MSGVVDPKRNLRLLQLYWFFSQFQLWIPVWIVYLTIEQGFSLTEVTLAEGLFLLGTVALEVPTGAFADRYGRSTSLGVGGICFGIAVLLFAFATSFPLLLVSFMTWSFASTFMNGADNAVLFDTLKASKRSAEYEHWSGRGQALIWAGVGVATLLGGPIASLTDTRVTIFAGAATCMLTAAVGFLISDPPREAHTQARMSFGQLIGVAFRELWHQPEIRAIVLLAGMTQASFEGANYLVQPYLVDRGVEVGTLFSFLQLPIFGAGLLGALFAARIQTRFGAPRALVIGPLFGLVSCVALAFVPGFGAYAGLAVIVALASANRPIATGYLNRRVSSDARATTLSMQGMVHSFVIAGVSPGVGFTTDRWGLPTAFAALAVLIGITVLAFGPRLLFGSRTSEPLLEPETP